MAQEVSEHFGLRLDARENGAHDVATSGGSSWHVLAWYLGGSSLLGLVAVTLQMSNLVDLGLGFTGASGRMLLAGMGVLALAGLINRYPAIQLAGALLWFLAPLGLDFLDLPCRYSALLGVFLVLLGGCGVLRVRAAAALWKGAFFLLAAYMQSVLLFDLVSDTCPAHFFR